MGNGKEILADNNGLLNRRENPMSIEKVSTKKWVEEVFEHAEINKNIIKKPDTQDICQENGGGDNIQKKDSDEKDDHSLKKNERNKEELLIIEDNEKQQGENIENIQGREVNESVQKAENNEEKPLDDRIDLEGEDSSF
ncbi:hypothetical protein P3L10_018328 [Capsicum annuum]